MADSVLQVGRLQGISSVLAFADLMRSITPRPEALPPKLLAGVAFRFHANALGDLGLHTTKDVSNALVLLLGDFRRPGMSKTFEVEPTVVLLQPNDSSCARCGCETLELMELGGPAFEVPQDSRGE